MRRVWEKLSLGFRRFILQNSYGRLIGLGFAPFLITPQDFEIIRGKSRGVLVRLGSYFTPALSAGAFIGFSVSFLVASHLPQFLQDVPDLSNEEYRKLVNRTVTTGRFGVWLIASITIFCAGISQWSFHRLRVWIFPRLGLRANPVAVYYFMLMAGSKAIWFGLLVLAVSFFLPSDGENPAHTLLRNAERYPWVVVMFFLLLGLMRRRAHYMERQRMAQIYPRLKDRFAAILTSPWTIFIAASLAYVIGVKFLNRA